MGTVNGYITAVISCNTLDGVVRIQFTAGLLPVTVQSLRLGSLLAQRGHGRTTLCLGVPAQEGVTALGSSSLDLNGCSSIIALCRNSLAGGCNGNHSTVQVCVEDHILIVCRHTGAVNTVQIQVCFTQTALHQAGVNLIAGFAVLCNRKQEGIALRTGSHSITEHTAGCGHPAGAQIVCKGNQCIKLLLIQLQIVGVNKCIDIILEGVQILLQQFSCLLFSDTVLLIVFRQHFF